MAEVEWLTAADHAAVDRLLLEAYGDYAERLGPGEWVRMREAFAQAPQRLPDARIAGVRGAGGLRAVVFYFPPGMSDRRLFPEGWASLRLLAVARAARGRGLARCLTDWCIARARQDGATHIGLHTSEVMTTARSLYERMGFVVDGELPTRFGLRYWRFVLRLKG